MASSVDADHIADLFSEFGPVSVRRMFGGAGIFADGLMFGLVAGGAVYLKTDAAAEEKFKHEGCGPFTYGTKDGQRVLTSYWQMPDRLYDDPEELAQWARAALATARAAAAGPKKRPAKKPAAKPKRRRRSS